jgi:hypothetical protein
MTDDSVSGYLARGWSIVALHGITPGGRCTCEPRRDGTPCPNPGKHPLYENWQKIPIRDPGVWQAIAGWRAERGIATNVGLATGRPSGVFALDVDPKNGGLETLREYEAKGWRLPPTWEQRTGGDGLHCLFTMPADFEPTNATGSLGPGLDIRGTGGQIVLAPSVTDKGAYEVLRDEVPWAGPWWLLDAIRPAPYSPREPVAHNPRTIDARAAAYAQRAQAGLLDDLRHEPSSRNSTAFRVACRLHELLNAGWLDYDETLDGYLVAAEQASGNKPDPFPESEARAVWENAAHRTMDKAAELPPSTLGGTALDFPQPLTGASGSSGLAPTTPHSPVAGPGLVFAAPGEAPTISSETSPGASATGLNLPPEFWASRPVLKQLQLAAHSRLVSADVVLYSVLTRLAALWPHQVKINNGIKDGASANLFAAVVGPSGSGKTSGVGVARHLLSRPPWLDRDAFADDRPLGTGEGIAEVYMGQKSVPKLDEHGTPIQDLKGAVKTEKVRAQVRHNALMHADEGEALAKLIERSGATVGETLRRAWVGGTIGQSNGRAETTRVVESGRYSLGMLIGFQPETAQPLLADSAAGTPQRFLWCWALDPSIPVEDVPDPGPLLDVWPAGTQAPEGGWLIGTAEVDLRPVTFVPSIIAELKPQVRAIATGELSLSPLDSHRPLMLVKLSTLLAQLDGRRNVTEADWALAHTVWETSRRVQDHLVSYGQAMAGKAAADRRAAHSAQELAVDEARADREQQHVERLALAVARLVQQEGRLTAGAVRKRLNSRDRKVAADALLTATERGWLIEEAGAYTPGSTHV